MDPKLALRDAAPEVLWLDRERMRPTDAAPWSETGQPAGSSACDLVVVGAGYTGLWAAIQAKERRPDRDVVVLEAGAVSEQASGRNGGFCSASLTHGLANGVDRFPDEIGRLVDLGRENFEGLVTSIERYGIECGLELSGNLAVAVAPWLVEPLREDFELSRRFGDDVVWLAAEELRGEVDSPTYCGGVWSRSGEAMVDPARLGRGLARVASDLGVRIHERTSMVGLDRSGSGVAVRCGSGATICAGSVVLATNAFRSPVRAINRRIAPVYDHVLATAPLSDGQLGRIGWRNRQGLADTTNLFHYYRLTDDNRIVWGGYDAVYHYGNRIDAALEQRDVTHGLLAAQFFETFPQLDDVRFTHRWGGVIDTCTRFAVGFGTALDGRVAYAAGYTGLGVGASRFGARVCLDLLDDPNGELCRMDFVRRRPVPFPPEPLRFVGISLTRRALARADRRRGRRGPWLRALDAAGLGFDS